MNIRQAILKAADHIEANPDHYEFWRLMVPDAGCKACMLGWIGKFLDLPAGTPNNIVKRAIAGDREWSDFYAHVTDASKSFAYQDSGYGAAKCMRLYADKYHPAEAAYPVQQEVVPWSACAWKPRVVEQVKP